MMPELTSNQFQSMPGSGLVTALIGSSNDGVIVTDAAGIILIFSPACEKLFGYAPRDVIGKNISVLFPPDRFADEQALVEEIVAGRSVTHIETLWRRKDASEMPLSLSAVSVRDGENQVAGALFTVRDISQAKTAETAEAMLDAELAHVSRLSAMGEMSAAIAHELNQPLTAITNYVKAAQRFLSADKPTPMQIQNARDAVEKAADQTIRAGTIIRYLRDFVEKRESQKSPENINQVIRQAVTLSLVGTAHTNIKIKLDLEPRMPRLIIDKIQIQQVLLNLIRNAIEAMAGKEKGEIHISSAAGAGGYAEITIRDTGPGFLPEMRGKLFHAFATTKRDGLGIGLKICQSIVEAHGGSIKALPTGPGATFQIRLPLP
jgi:two-component system sensor kinase FixL